MAKENEFTKILQNSVADGVLDNRTELEKKKDELKKQIEELESNVIKDPRTLEKLKKELASVNKEINKEQVQKAIENGDVVGENAAEKDKDEYVKKEEEKENKDDKNLKQPEKDDENEKRLQQVYHDAIVAYYNTRLESLKHQKEKGELLSSDLDYKKEVKLELEMYKARKAYIALGKEDPYEKFREQHDFIDRQAHAPYEKKLAAKTERYRQIEIEVEQIDKGIAEINEELDTKDLSQMERDKRKDRISELEAKKTKLDLEKAEHKDAQEIVETQRIRTSNTRELQKLRREAASKEQIKGYDYRRTQKQISQHNLDEAQKNESENIQKRIEERERRIDELNRELENTPDGDLEKRLNILESLNKETNKVEADKEQKRVIDKGYVMTEQELKTETYKEAQIEKEVEKQFEEDTREVKEAIENKDKMAGEMAVSNASIVGAEAEAKETDINLKAAIAAEVIDSPKPGKDTIGDDVMQFVGAKYFIKGLEDEVRDPNKLEDAKAMVEHDEQLNKTADHELDKIQENLQKN